MSSTTEEKTPMSQRASSAVAGVPAWSHDDTACGEAAASTVASSTEHSTPLIRHRRYPPPERASRAAARAWGVDRTLGSPYRQEKFHEAQWGHGARSCRHDPPRASLVLTVSSLQYRFMDALQPCRVRTPFASVVSVDADTIVDRPEQFGVRDLSAAVSRQLDREEARVRNGEVLVGMAGAVLRVDAHALVPPVLLCERQPVAPPDELEEGSALLGREGLEREPEELDVRHRGARARAVDSVLPQRADVDVCLAAHEVHEFGTREQPEQPRARDDRVDAGEDGFVGRGALTQPRGDGEVDEAAARAE
eukprot:CAMPEP_0115851088 /NCGR_PEP_ID=MMETSP0287-20121206/12298_1 /TAXON_ID=412157 /ORGANISM="Chrysochromulina rotalis, Strain UIO044" /LENGTH=306 /DNA_ID=CAMNT_0003305103 /DNA_START=249 /DNA_END=1167 /DNA_ORIENTATION=-